MAQNSNQRMIEAPSYFTAPCGGVRLNRRDFEVDVRNKTISATGVGIGESEALLYHNDVPEIIRISESYVVYDLVLHFALDTTRQGQSVQDIVLNPYIEGYITPANVDQIFINQGYVTLINTSQVQTEGFRNVPLPMIGLPNEMVGCNCETLIRVKDINNESQYILSCVYTNLNQFDQTYIAVAVRFVERRE